jgi:ribosomal subunit interface protein
MKYTLYKDNIELTELDETFLDKKLNRLEKHVPLPFSCHVSIRRDSHHRTGNVITCKMTIASGKKSFHAERSADTIQDCLDEVIKALSHELEREHDKNKDKKP